MVMMANALACIGPITLESPRRQQCGRHSSPCFRGAACRRPRRSPSGQRDDQFGGVAAPVDGDDEGAHARLVANLRLLARQYARHRDHEVAAEVAARVAGGHVGDLPNQTGAGPWARWVPLHLLTRHGALAIWGAT